MAMLCPVCSTELQTVERQDIELDHCPTCEGIWLDQGELSELVRREALAAIIQGHQLLFEGRKQKEYDAELDNENSPNKKAAIVLDE